jgi:hypothetical protein
MKTEKKVCVDEKFLMFSTYTAIYLNDIACNAVLDIKPYIQDKDKETQKIYGALHKRAKNYLRFIKDILKDNIYFLADFCSYMDDGIDEYIETFNETIKCTLDENKINDSIFLSKVEFARTMLLFSIKTIERLCEDLDKMGVKTYTLKTYRQEEMYKIICNFCKWTYRKVDYSIDWDNEKTVRNAFKAMEEHIIDYALFESAYKYAVDESKEREENGKD